MAGSLQPVGELEEVGVAGRGRYGLMISGTEEDGKVAERRELMGDEVGPRPRLVIDDVQRLAGHVQAGRWDQILIEGVDRAEVSEVPIELGLAFEDAGSDRGHDDVAAVSGIA
jgi:hypothetical protein